MNPEADPITPGIVREARANDSIVENEATRRPGLHLGNSEICRGAYLTGWSETQV